MPSLFERSRDHLDDAVIEHREAHHAEPVGSGAPLLALFALFHAALPWAIGVPPLFALPLSLLSLAYLPAYWWSELRAAEPLEA